MSEKTVQQTKRARLIILAVVLTNILIAIGLTVAYGLLPALRPVIIWFVLIDLNLTAVAIAGALMSGEAFVHFVRVEAEYLELKANFNKANQALATIKEAHETISRDYDKLRGLNALPPFEGKSQDG